MAKEHLPPATQSLWTDLFYSQSHPVALLQIHGQTPPTLLCSNTAFVGLFGLQNQALPLRLTLLPSELLSQLQKKQATQVTYCFSTEKDNCRHFQLQIAHSPKTPDIMLLIMQDVSEQETTIELLKNQNEALQQRLASIEQLKNRIREQSIRDPLTNLYNRRFLNEFMERELALARRNQKPLAVVMLDLDHFKQLNDQFGHQTGDTVIEMVAKLLLRKSRRTDVLFRYGGEEFLVILPNTTTKQAQALTESWRQHVEQTSMIAKHQTVSITLSAGISVYPEHGSTAFNLIQAADEALYQAKAAGRNKVVLC